MIDSTVPPEDWRQRLNAPGPVVILPASKRRDPFEAAYLGAECAGAAAGLIGVISRDSLKAAIQQELESMNPEVVEENLEIALAAFDQMAVNVGIVTERDGISADTYDPPDWTDVPADDVSISGPAIYKAANSVEVRTGLWRTMRPVIDHERCNRSTWVCGSFCPDGAISIGEGGFPHIDLDHCKGCMICVAQCPPHAIAAVAETDAAAHEKKGEPA